MISQKENRSQCPEFFPLLLRPGSGGCCVQLPRGGAAHPRIYISTNVRKTLDTTYGA